LRLGGCIRGKSATLHTAALLRPLDTAPLHALARLGETERAELALAGLGEQGREHGEVRIAAAALRLAQDDPCAATAALEPVLDGPVPVNWRTWLA